MSLDSTEFNAEDVIVDKQARDTYLANEPIVLFAVKGHKNYLLDLSGQNVKDRQAVENVLFRHYLSQNTV